MLFLSLSAKKKDGDKNMQLLQYLAFVKILKKFLFARAAGWKFTVARLHVSQNYSAPREQLSRFDLA